MALFKCKMCGGTLEIVNNESIATCEYCGTQQTLPRLDDERRANLYDRANHFRRNNEFDKAMGIYEKILNEDNTDAEAYWSLVLCRYGIEYVEDPSSHKRIPTVNRAQFTSVFNDDNYKSALQYADRYQRNIYEGEAKAINEIQKGILAISQKEEPFDVFICYKENDNHGRRTPDSVLANELYHQLVQEGFRVFYARITLEDKLGFAYEPYIFAALNSAKVMVVLGTKPEFFNAVWVKNEWSRYLALIKQGQKKILIPAYKDMDPYDLPEEFSHLQAQDMSKLGFMQDLIRGIKKITEAEVPKKAVVKEMIISGESTNTTPLLKRAYMFLEDGEWDSADEYCEKVLDIDPENAYAYLGKMMAGMKVRKQEELKGRAEPFDQDSYYQKVVRFADENLKKVLASYVEHIKMRNENSRMQEIYAEAKDVMSHGYNEFTYITAACLFESISGYEDADSLTKICYERAEAEHAERERKEEIRRLKSAKIARKSVKILVPIICVIIAFIFVLNEIIIPNRKYDDAIALIGTGSIIEAYEALVALDGYKDSAEKANLIYNKYEAEKKAEKLKNAKKGDYVFFGTYEQDNIFSNGKEEIEWLVLEVKNGKALLMSRYALDCKPYNTRDASVTWETCSLREWLNSSFMNAAFTTEEKQRIPATTVYTYNPLKKIQDQVFLLEMPANGARLCEPTAYAIAKGVWASSRGYCAWWLCGPGYYEYCASYVESDGEIAKYGGRVSTDSHGVRPALWITLDV